MSLHLNCNVNYYVKFKNTSNHSLVDNPFVVSINHLLLRVDIQKKIRARGALTIRQQFVPLQNFIILRFTITPLDEVPLS
jgi:hypothetical protein